jgi:hypothetical protein
LLGTSNEPLADPRLIVQLDPETGVVRSAPKKIWHD